MKQSFVVVVFIWTFLFAGNATAQTTIINEQLDVQVQVQAEDGSVQSGTVTGISVQAKPVSAEATATVTDDSETLDGIIVKTPEKAPSGVGIWWRGVRERVSLAVTRDPVKRAEKQLRFAEERMQIAQTIAEKSTDPKVQARAEAMVAKANEYMQKIADKKDEWMAKKDEQSARLLKNIATHELRREKVMDRLEEKLPEEALLKIREHRAEALEGSKRLLNAIGNENVPENIREHLKNVKERIETHAVEVKAFREKSKELLDKVKSGDEAAKTELKTLREDRKEEVKVQATVKEGRVERKEVRQDAKVELKETDDKIERKEIRVETKEKLGEMRKEVKQEVKDMRQKPTPVTAPAVTQ